MATRGSQFTRTMQYFRTADIDEARAAHSMATKIVTERGLALAATSVTKVRKARKPKHAATEVAAGAAQESGGK